MTIGILSDIHGNLPALEAVIADAQARGCNRFVNLGDILSGPLWPRETADFLIEREWLTIRGNHERQLLSLAPTRMGASDRHARERLDDHHLRWLKSLPPKSELQPEIFLCHGSPRSDVEYFLESLDGFDVRAASDEEVIERADGRLERVILCGHTHVPRTKMLPDGRLVANPGSVGLQAYQDDRPVPHRIECHSPHARYALLDGWTVELLEVEYDHEAAARQAERHDRPDWAVALRFGNMTEPRG
jgi:predicted phosphodiesterase